MSRSMAIAMLAFVAAAVISAGCAHTGPSGPITIHGELRTGPECPLLVTSDGHRYSVTGSLGSFKIGDRVCIRGTTTEVSYCMAGETTVSVEAIGPENDCP